MVLVVRRMKLLFCCGSQQAVEGMLQRAGCIVARFRYETIEDLCGDSGSKERRLKECVPLGVGVWGCRDECEDEESSSNSNHRDAVHEEVFLAA